MFRKALSSALCCMMLVVAGCASDSRRGYDDPVNGPWLQGAGYNNPNAERIRNGQKPLNFDGTEHDNSFLGSFLSGFFGG